MIVCSSFIKHFWSGGQTSPRSAALLGLVASSYWSCCDDNQWQGYERPSAQCESGPISSKQGDTWIHRISGTLVTKGGGSVLGLGQQHSKKNQPRPHLGHVETWKDVSWKSHKGRSGWGYVQFVFHGADMMTTKNAHWIQFIRRQKWDHQGNPVDNSEHLPVHHGLWQKRGEWFLDVPPQAHTPWYDEWAMHQRTSTSVAIFDCPMGILDPRWHSCMLIEMETYLVVEGRVVWRVSWQVEETPVHGRRVRIHGMPVDNHMIPDLETILLWKIGYTSDEDESPESTIFMEKHV